MDWKREQNIIKEITKVAEQIHMIGQSLEDIEGVSTSARNSKYELLHIIQLFKIENEKEADKKKK